MESPPPKEIKKNQIEGCGSLKGERLGKSKMCGCPQEKTKDAFVIQH